VIGRISFLSIGRMEPFSNKPITNENILSWHSANVITSFLKYSLMDNPLSKISSSIIQSNIHDEVESTIRNYDNGKGVSLHDLIFSISK
jgi:hypothetical protein